MKKNTRILFILFILFIILFFKKYFPEKQNQILVNEKMKKVELVRVVDGDTLVLNIEGDNEKIRLIGMNAPESVKPNHPVECFGHEASNHAVDILNDKELFFLGDYSQDTRDRFGRLLGYILMTEKKDESIKSNFAELMISDGYAYEYTYNKNKPYIYQADFKKAEQTARNDKLGLWANNACKFK